MDIDRMTIFLRVARSVALERPVRNREWLDWVASRKCAACGEDAAEAHHLFGSVFGMKSSDLFVVPICRKHHIELQNAPLSDARVERFLLSWLHLIHAAVRDGRLTFR